MHERRAVRRRRVFYVPGFDPHPPRRYRELYRREAAEQARIAGYAVSVAGRPGEDGWDVRLTGLDGDVETRVEVLDWSDIARGAARARLWATYLSLVRTVWIYLSTGTLHRLARLRRGPVLAACYPVAALLLALGLAVLLGDSVARLATPLMTAPVGLALGALAAWAMLAAFRAADGRHFAFYLMHDYAFLSAGRGRTDPGLEERTEAFAARIEAALAEDCDEVLIVGHSTGAQVAVSALARVGPAPGRPELGLLTLGQSIPMVSLLPEAHALRAELGAVGARADLTWVDVSAPSDGCAFALCDPVAVSGGGGAGPLVLSAAFTERLSPERRRALRWRPFRTHFQYLCAFDDPAPYDFFAITAGPLSLGQRFAERRPSRQRITRAAA